MLDAFWMWPFSRVIIVVSTYGKNSLVSLRRPCYDAYMKSRNIPCVHGKQRNYCRDCGGASICEHGRQRPSCRDCGGTRFCNHFRTRRTCKLCGTHYKLLQGGFTPEEIREIGSQFHCQFPECYIRYIPPTTVLEGRARTLNSDHLHDGHRINPENYRGEVCLGCNIRLKSLDEHPEWATPSELAYMQRRPYSRKNP